jgi:hypothetical protein
MNIDLNRRLFTVSGLLSVMALIQKSRAQSSDASFETLLQKLETDPALSINTIGHDELSETLVPGLETAPLRAPKSTTPISDQAIALIVASEVSSSSTYNQKYKSPIWPKGQSGVTIGVGYDVGYVKPMELQIDWKDYIPANQILSLQPACGEKGPAARDILPTIPALVIAWPSAYAQFKHEMIPRYVGLVERSLENTSLLPSDCLGALVSLVYNRCASFNLKGDRFSEMRQISDAMEAKNFTAIPGYIRSMKRLWGPDLSGLWVRRDAEAKLFELGLAKG